jgi:hypothetical protein
MFISYSVLHLTLGTHKEVVAIVCLKVLSWDRLNPTFFAI